MVKVWRLRIESSIVPKLLRVTLVESRLNVWHDSFVYNAFTRFPLKFGCYYIYTHVINVFTLSLLQKQHACLDMMFGYPIRTYAYLFKAGSYPESNIDEDRSHMSFINLGEDTREPWHGFHSYKVLRVLPVIHSSQHSTQDSSGKMRHLLVVNNQWE